MKKYKNDIIFVAILLIIAVAVTFATRLFYARTGEYVKITVDGKEEILLNLGENKEYRVEHGDDINIVKIKNGTVSVTEANCRDSLCMKQGSIKKNGDSIICLPHKVVISIVSKEKNEVDAVAE